VSAGRSGPAVVELRDGGFEEASGLDVPDDDAVVNADRSFLLKLRLDDELDLARPDFAWGNRAPLKRYVGGRGTRSVLAKSIGAIKGANVVRKFAQSPVVVVEPFSIDPPMAANSGCALWASRIFSHQSGAGRQ
jgi:hypothetical protein